MSVYLDYNATTPVDPVVLDVMIDVYKNHYGNADSRTHSEGIYARELVENARQQIANLLDIQSHEVIYTGGATESDNIAILGLAQWGKENNKRHIVSTSIEHKAILEPLHFLENHGFEVDYILPKQTGRVEVEDVLAKVRADTLMVCMMHANNETGILQPIHEIGEALNKIGVYFLIDAAQTCGKMVRELCACKYDFLSASAHKMHGPQGIGFLVAKRKNYQFPPLKPIMYGGGQENGLRPGTLPVALIAGLGCAAQLAGGSYQKWKEVTSKTKRKLLKILSESGLTYVINGAQEYCMPNTINISFQGVDSEALMLALKGTCSFSNGSACTAKDYSSSFVLSAMGLSEERIGSAIRLSWDMQDIMDGFSEILEMVKKIYR